MSPRRLLRSPRTRRRLTTRPNPPSPTLRALACRTRFGSTLATASKAWEPNRTRSGTSPSRETGTRVRRPPAHSVRPTTALNAAPKNCAQNCAMNTRAAAVPSPRRPRAGRGRQRALRALGACGPGSPRRPAASIRSWQPPAGARHRPCNDRTPGRKRRRPPHQGKAGGA